MTDKDYILVVKDGKLEAFQEVMKDILEYKGYKVIRRIKQPTVSTMQKWLDNGIARAIDGCEVELDGTCEHNCPSWLLKLGLI